MKKIFILILMMAGLVSARAQNINNGNAAIAKDVNKVIAGKVVGEKSTPLRGAIVKLKSGPANVTTTDANGNYKIASHNEYDTLIVSYIGYNDQKISTKDKTVINAILLPKSK